MNMETEITKVEELTDKQIAWLAKVVNSKRVLTGRLPLIGGFLRKEIQKLIDSGAAFSPTNQQEKTDGNKI